MRFSVLWTAQGAFITRWSDSRNINKHFSIFWALLQLSQIVGGLYVYLSLADVTYIDRRLRLQLFGGMLGCGAVGTLLFLGLRPPPATSQPEDPPVLSVPNTEDCNDVRVSHPKMVFDSTLKTFCRSFKLLPSPVMLCILVTAGFTGVNITFWSSLFSSCIGHTLAFGSRAKSSMGLVVIFVGVGEILGSAITNLRRWIPSTGLATIFGYTGAVLGAFFCLLMLPPDSPIRETERPTYIQPSVELGMFVAVLFGMVDAVWNTQMSVLIGDVYRSRPDDIPVAFALYRCIQSVLAAITFSYCNHLLLQWQVLIYILWATLGVGCYFYASWLQFTTQ
ncbi:UNC93-like protein MFSD11 [Clonorchis sinensis]|uniref:UNC93-like protein MFSD11 n=1 Tax=Clonorchis sinensis TaxID=79923 RepID=G7Y991_CLOSI|nr:UNC93-like protein MFSD11 [Clonorchis sinensis]